MTTHERRKILPQHHSKAPQPFPVTMDVDMSCQSTTDNECRLRKNRIKIYRSILNYYKGRSVSLDFVLASKQPNINILPDVKSYKALGKDIQGLHDDIMLMQSIKNCLNLVNYSLTSNELMSIDDINIKRNSLEKIEGIIFFSNSIMKLYKESCNELELINRMKDYSALLDEYMKNLERMKENDQSRNGEESQEVEKAELHIYKINLMRTMKSVLLGYISLNCPNLLKDVLEFKSSCRRDLTIDDFRETWDVGLK